MDSHIPAIVLAEHEHGRGDDMDRCPCGSSLFRLFGETELNDDGTGELTWWQICAVCGQRYGGYTETFTKDEKGEFDSRMRKWRGLRPTQRR